MWAKQSVCVCAFKLASNLLIEVAIHMSKYCITKLKHLWDFVLLVNVCANNKSTQIKPKKIEMMSWKHQHQQI